MTTRLILAAALCAALTSCFATLESEVESTTDLILESISRDGDRSRRIAVVGTSGETSLGHLAAIWEVADGTVVNHPDFDGVSPALVQNILRRMNRDPRSLYAARGREELLAGLEEEGQCPDFLMYIQISRLKKSGPGVSTPEYMATFELIDVSNGNRLAKEATNISMSRYR